jgi:Tfp pilus assembly protein PilF
MRAVAAFENHLKQVPEDARARILIAGYYAELNRVEDAIRETTMAMTLRANEASILYNAACVFCSLGKKSEALDALRKAYDAGFKDPNWARRDPDMAPLLGDPEFERMFPPTETTS